MGESDKGEESADSFRTFMSGGSALLLVGHQRWSTPRKQNQENSTRATSAPHEKVKAAAGKSLC